MRQEVAELAERDSASSCVVRVVRRLILQDSTDHDETNLIYI